MSSHWDRQTRRVRLTDGTKVEIYWGEVHSLPKLCSRKREDEWFRIDMRASGAAGPPDGRQYLVSERTWNTVMTWLHYQRTGENQAYSTEKDE